MINFIKHKKMSDATGNVCAPFQWEVSARAVKSRASVCQSVIAEREVS